MSNSTVTLVIPARADYLLLTRLALTGMVRTTAVDEEVLADLRLAVTEAAANAIRHAYPAGRGDVTVTYTLGDDNRLEVDVDDNGPGFNEAEVARWDPERLGEDGMGLAIIRAVADEVEIGSRPDGTGTRLRFVKSLG